MERRVGERRGRPRKPDGERLEPVTTNLPPELYRYLCRLAAERRVPVAELVRDVVIEEFQHGSLATPRQT